MKVEREHFGRWFCLSFLFLLSAVSADAAPELTARYSYGGDAKADTLDGFGGSVATNGPWLFVGAPYEQSSRKQPDGAVYIYRKTLSGPYVFVKKLAGTQTSPDSDPLDSDPPDGDHFGGGVISAGEWLFVGAANNQDFPGGKLPYAGKVFAYHLEGENWTLKQALVSSNPRSDGRFGTRNLSKHMATNGDATLLVVGEPVNSWTPGQAGSLHLFVRRGSIWAWKQSIVVEKDTQTIDYFAADSIVWLGNHIVVKVSGDTFPNPHSRRAISTQSKLYVYPAPTIDGFPQVQPVQIIQGIPYNPSRCIIDFNNLGFAGMAAGGTVFAVAQPCLDTAAGVQTGRLDIYSYTGLAGAPLVFKQSMNGTIPFGRLGSTTSGGQESIAVAKDGRRIMVGATIGGNAVETNPANASSADVRLYEANAGSWFLRAILKQSNPKRLFGQVVAFGFDANNPALAPALVSEPGRPIDENGPIGALYSYDIGESGRPSPTPFPIDPDASIPSSRTPTEPGVVSPTPFEKCNAGCDAQLAACLRVARDAVCQPQHNACVRRCNP